MNLFSLLKSVVSKLCTIVAQTIILKSFISLKIV